MNTERGTSGARTLMGYTPEKTAENQTQIVLDVGPQHMNQQNMLHGGFSATLLDTAMGTTAGLHADPGGALVGSTVSLTVNYLAPGREGRVTATARVTGGGRRTIFVEGALHHEDGTLIATATGVFRAVAAAGPV